MQTSKLERDPAGRAFARLTAIFEDAAGLAAKRQSPRLSIRGRRTILARPRAQMDKAEIVLVMLASSDFNQDTQR